MIASAPPRLCPVKNRACSGGGRFASAVRISGHTVLTAAWKPLWSSLTDGGSMVKSVIQSSILSGSVPANATIVAPRPPATTAQALCGGRPVMGSLLANARIVRCQALRIFSTLDLFAVSYASCDIHIMAWVLPKLNVEFAAKPSSAISGYASRLSSTRKLTGQPPLFSLGDSAELGYLREEEARLGMVRDCGKVTMRRTNT